MDEGNWDAVDFAQFDKWGYPLACNILIKTYRLLKAFTLLDLVPVY